MIFFTEHAVAAMDVALALSCSALSIFFLARCALQGASRVRRADKASWRLALVVDGLDRLGRLRAVAALCIAAIGPEIFGQAAIAAMLLAAPEAMLASGLGGAGSGAGVAWVASKADALASAATPTLKSPHPWWPQSQPRPHPTGLSESMLAKLLAGSAPFGEPAGESDSK